MFKVSHIHCIFMSYCEKYHLCNRSRQYWVEDLLGLVVKPYKRPITLSRREKLVAGVFYARMTIAGCHDLLACRLDDINDDIILCKSHALVDL